MLGLAIIALKALQDLFYIIGALILLQALISWLPGLSESRFGAILASLTEPINGPIRRFLARFEALRNIPVDFSPTVAILLMVIIGSVIQTILAFLIAMRALG